ncbi:L-fucose:H+ symporter permease [uncultured Friedmanniella sp.]|uniref:L-fucose:H+ symporter permease n=1 Tax=uncultured Friedmanniella sp. TaxID=335381 RepID=UPI0035CB9C13
MTTRNEPEVEQQEESSDTHLVYPQLVVPFVLLILCFAAWGSAANLSEVMVSVFRKIFTGMSNFQSGLVTFAYYGAYFLLAIPAAFINRRFGYKTGVLTGLGLAAVGGVLFFPASQALTYGAFLAALFVLAAGLSILETSANPFAIAMGPEETATRRLNLAQVFNPVGANVGVLLGAIVITPNIILGRKGVPDPTGPDLLAAQEHDLNVVLGPYLGIAAVLVVIWLLIAFKKIPVPQEQIEQELLAGGDEQKKGWLGRLARNPHYRYGVVAQFFNIAAQVGTWSFTIQYAENVVGATPRAAGWYLQASLILFLVSRFVMFVLLGIFRPTKLLAAMAGLGVVLALTGVLSPNMVGLIAVVCISLCLSLMFPTIYGVALQGLGADTKFGAAGLVMAILGGALVSPVQGAIVDATGSQAAGFLIPAFGFAVVLSYAIFDLTTKRHSEALVGEV